MLHSNYLRHITNETIHDTVKWLVKTIRSRPNGLNYDAIAVRGFSGTIPGAIVAYLLKKPLIFVRKTTSGGSHGRGVEILGAITNPYTYIWIDDQISSGGTKRSLQGALTQGKCVGELLYNNRKINVEGTGLHKSVTWI